MGTLSPSRRLIPSSSMKAKVSIVVSFLSSSRVPSGESRHHVTTYPRELFPLLSANIHFRNTLLPESSATIRGSAEEGGCSSEEYMTNTVIQKPNIQIIYTSNNILQYLNDRNTFVFIYLKNIKAILCEIEEGNWLLKLPWDISVTVNFRLC